VRKGRAFETKEAKGTKSAQQRSMVSQLRRMTIPSRKAVELMMDVVTRPMLYSIGGCFWSFAANAKLGPLRRR
jgi:hypothetical protein